MKHLALLAMIAVTACSEEIPSFPTFQECFDNEPFADPAHPKIVYCCLDVVIDGDRYACGATQPECINYITANLDQTDASPVEVSDACAEYEDLLPAPMQGE